MLSRLQAERLDHEPPSRAEELEGLRLPAGAVERQHELAAQTIAQRVLGDQPLELGNEPCMPSQGEIRLDNKRIDNLPAQERDALRNGTFGFIFQFYHLLPELSTLENVLMQVELRGLNPRDYKDRALRMLEQVGLKDFADRYPFELSGGMRQRVAIARALIHDAPLLLMDEPFGALDALTREQMRLDLEALWLATRKTVLFITHSIDEAVLLADRVVVMSPRPGKIECVMDIALSRPRGLEARRAPAFVEATERITELFLARGVLHGAGATPIEGDRST